MNVYGERIKKMLQPHLPAELTRNGWNLDDDPEGAFLEMHNISISPSGKAERIEVLHNQYHGNDENGNGIFRVECIFSHTVAKPPGIAFDDVLGKDIAEAIVLSYNEDVARWNAANPTKTMSLV